MERPRRHTVGRFQRRQLAIQTGRYYCAESKLKPDTYAGTGFIILLNTYHFSEQVNVDILSVAILAFVVLETLNVLLLYFAPESKKGNGVGVFRAFKKSKDDPEIHTFVVYLVDWIAGSKLIFISLLLVIAFVGNSATKILSIVALIPSILTFYWRLFPAIKKLDSENQMDPKGYSRTLAIMIAGFIGAFAVVLIIHFVR